jgi:hypothetical protein
VRTGNAGKGAIVTSLAGISLAAGDYTDFIDQLAVAIGLPTRSVPLVYIGLFLCALLLLRLEYDSADYDFVVDPQTEYVREEPSEEGEYWYSETHRVCVRNHGRTPINVSVTLRSISPEPASLSGKLGMPLIAMGEPRTTTVQINPTNRAAFNVVSYYCDPSQNGDEVLTIWHDWITAPRTIACVYSGVAYTFELVLTPAEGPVKTATYELRFEGRSKGMGRVFRLNPVIPLGPWRRFRERMRQIGEVETAANDA